jgi:hypothetical protein
MAISSIGKSACIVAWHGIVITSQCQWLDWCAYLVTWKHFLTSAEPSPGFSPDGGTEAALDLSS